MLSQHCPVTGCLRVYYFGSSHVSPGETCHHHLSVGPMTLTTTTPPLVTERPLWTQRQKEKHKPSHLMRSDPWF